MLLLLLAPNLITFSYVPFYGAVELFEYLVEEGYSRKGAWALRKQTGFSWPIAHNEPTIIEAGRVFFQPTADYPSPGRRQ
jgi:hypothetical protein